MTILKVTERPYGQSTSWSTTERQYTRTFKVETDNVKESIVAIVFNTAGVPRVGHAHPNDSQAYCNDVSAQRVDGGKGKFDWVVTCQYSTKLQLNESPTLDPAHVDWGTDQFQRPAVRESNGQMILNSAGDPYDPPESMDDSRITATVTKNLANPPAWLLDYADAVNNDSFTLDGVKVGVGFAKIQRVSIRKTDEIRNGVQFREVQFQIDFANNAFPPRQGKSWWALQILDAGFREKPDEFSRIRTNMKNSGDNERPTAPILLDGNGKKLEMPGPFNAQFRSHEVYKLRPFSVLPLT